MKNVNRQGEIIWLVFVALSVAYLLWICLAGSAAFLIATLVSFTLASSDAVQTGRLLHANLHFAIVASSTNTDC